MRICVFGSSSRATTPKYYDESVRLGELIAKKGHTLVNGAGKFGVMGGVNEGAFANNGEVIGVIHRCFYVDHGEDPRIKNLVITDGWDLSDRKEKLFENSDCVIIMPGGVGTFDEMWDGISSKALDMKGLGRKPIVVVNIDGYYDGSIQQLHRAKQDGILYHNVEDYFHVETDVEKALEYCIQHGGETQTAHQGHCNHAQLAESRKSTREPINIPQADTKVPSDSHVKTASTDFQRPCWQKAAIALALVGTGILIGMKVRK